MVRAAPIQAGESLPPQAAKNVRTIFRIEHRKGIIIRLTTAI